MISYEVFTAFFITSLVIEATPGPNMAYLALLSASKGRKCGFAATAGIAVGLLLIGIAAALGLAVIISNSPFLYQTLRWGGVFYMLWLAWDGWRGEAETSPGKTLAADTLSKYFRRGMITNLLNPKAAVFYVAILPSYIQMNDSIALQGLTLTILYVAVATFIHTTIVLIAGAAQKFLSDPVREQTTRRTLSVLLALIAFWFAWKTRL